MVKFEVEATRVADWITFRVASPQSRRCRQTVGTLQPSTTSPQLQVTNVHSSYTSLTLLCSIAMARLYVSNTDRFSSFFSLALSATNL